MHDDDTDTLDFAMLTPPTRPGPARATVTTECDVVEAKLERERQAAPHIAVALCLEGRPDRIVDGRLVDIKCTEVRHGSGKVKV